MKKRVLMMLLAGVLALSMIGCGGGDADQEDPGNDEQVVDTEGSEQDEEKNEAEGEEEKGEDEGKDGEEDPSQNGGGSTQTPAETSKPVSSQPAKQPAQQKPTQQAPAQQKPAEQKPAQTQTPTKPSDSGAGNSAASSLSSMTLEDIITKSYGDLELPETEAKEVDTSDANLMEWYFGTTDLTFKRAVASEAFISSIAHSVIAVEAEDGADVEALAAKIKENANARKWVCVEPEQVGVAYRGNIILFAMSDSADAIIENFKAL